MVLKRYIFRIYEDRFLVPLAPGADTENESVEHNPRLLDAPAVPVARLVIVVRVTKNKFSQDFSVM